LYAPYQLNLNSGTALWVVTHPRKVGKEDQILYSGFLKNCFGQVLVAHTCKSCKAVESLLCNLQAQSPEFTTRSHQKKKKKRKRKNKNHLPIKDLEGYRKG
jgi:hypothetical protein